EARQLPVVEALRERRVAAQGTVEDRVELVMVLDDRDRALGRDDAGEQELVEVQQPEAACRNVRAHGFEQGLGVEPALELGQLPALEADRAAALEEPDRAAPGRERFLGSLHDLRLLDQAQVDLGLRRGFAQEVVGADLPAVDERPGDEGADEEHLHPVAPAFPLFPPGSAVPAELSSGRSTFERLSTMPIGSSRKHTTHPGSTRSALERPNAIPSARATHTRSTSWETTARIRA